MLKFSSNFPQPDGNNNLTLGHGDEFQTLESNKNLVYKIKKITYTDKGEMIQFDRGDGTGSTHTLSRMQVIDYIKRGRMIPINKI